MRLYITIKQAILYTFDITIIWHDYSIFKLIQLLGILEISIYFNQSNYLFKSQANQIVEYVRGTNN